ncbi:phospholipid-transporting ATPase IB-like [Watersipora subatra]|uniref:phospholipid-transporting ATPase IB-like n=1 Tax=Watersipora subatra TaxID=2589382 RepID=UPI00355B89C6
MDKEIEAYFDDVKLKQPSLCERLSSKLCLRRGQLDDGASTSEKQPLFQGRNTLWCCGAAQPLISKHRSIHLGVQDTNSFISNRISTGKYHVWSFLPRFLFEQFRKYANIFFLLICCLQQIPGVSPTGKYTTLMPLLFILLLSALKELVEDIKRHQADSKVNNSTVSVLKDKVWTTVKWKDLRVGDFIKLTNGSLIPADTLLLSSSEPQSIAYIETANLDGETNLKIRKGISKTSHLLTASQLADFSARIECEGPNRLLYDFVGTIYIDSRGVPLGPNEMLLRGSKLKNTSWIFGVVVYTGEESKLRLNSVKTPLKRSHVEKLTNIQILLLFGTLLFLSMFTAVANLVWTRGRDGLWFIDSVSYSFTLQFLTYIILYNNLIPISLQVTLEFVKFVQAFYINWDQDMYYAEADCPAMVRTSNLNEELGQIKYIFSDKTGTLTRNVMEFKGCSIDGVIYRDDITEGEIIPLKELKKRAAKKVDKDTGKIKDFLELLAVCHTVVPEKNDGDYIYRASSPDEAALVKGAQSMGWQFTERTPDTITISTPNGVEKYELLNVIDFTSARKRMSVVVRDKSGTIKLMCKGADSVILERLATNQSLVPLLESQLQSFAHVGLRTLCLAVRVLKKDEYDSWNKKYHEASIAISKRDELVAAAAELLEVNLTLVGATAIEDKLQEGVPDCIASLAKADIKIWVLTGDKQETAINIGYSCCLLTTDMPLMIINARSHDDTKVQIKRAITEFGPSIQKSNNVALIIDGQTLTHVLQYAKENSCLMTDFLKIAISCKAVICCRVSPIQKAEIVALVKKFVGAITLAIGDGANDVGMIQAADVGIGINGLEGTQAVCAADYAIGQFRFLKKLLLVHGLWNYYRICKLVLYSFYKNICLYVIELWFQIYNGYSGQILFERWSIGFYNVIFTFFPPLALGLLDRYTDTELPMRYPTLYKISQDSTLFNVKVFWMWITNAILHSVVLYFFSMLMLETDSSHPTGGTNGFLYLGNCVFTYTVVTVCLKAGMESYTWTWMHFVAIFGSILSWFAFVGFYSELWPTVRLGAAEDMAGQSRQLASNPVFWLGLILIPGCALLRDFVWKIVRRTFFISIKEKVEIFHNDSTINRRLGTKSGSSNPRSTDVQESGAKAKNKNSDFYVTKLFTKVFAPAAIYQFKPSQHSMLEQSKSQHGFAFSQDENSKMKQSDLIRIMNSNVRKPLGM